MLLMNMMGWVKWTIDKTAVNPTLISNLKESHKAMITDIAWVPADTKMTRNGRFEKVENKLSTQICTCSIDGMMMFWDIEVIFSLVSGKRKFKYLQRAPSGLECCATNVVEQKIFRPVFKISLSKLPIISITRLSCFSQYESVDGWTDPRPEKRTYFELYDFETTDDRPLFRLTTTTGKIVQATFKGFDYDAGSAVNTQEATLMYYESVHDGPITFYGIYPTDKHYSLTIGGTVFAIWHAKETFPLLWRKAVKGCKYFSGGWSTDRPGNVFLIRSDGLLEIWHLLVSSTKPIRTINVGCDKFLNCYGFLTSGRCRKGTFACSDEGGSVTIFHVPEMVHMLEEEQELMSFVLQRSKKKVKYIREWMDRYAEAHQRDFKRKSGSIDSIITARLLERGKQSLLRTERTVSDLEALTTDIPEEKKIQTPEEKALVDIMLYRKNLDLEEIMLYKKNLQQQEKEGKVKLLKLAKLLREKNQKVVHTSLNLLQGYKRHFTERIFSQDLLILDSRLIEYYDEIEQQALKSIQRNSFILHSKLNAVKGASQLSNFVEEMEASHSSTIF